MVVFEIDGDRITSLAPKCKIPGPVDMDRVADRLPAQSVEVELIHVFSRQHQVQGVKPEQQATTQIAPNSVLVSPLPKALERTVAEGRDHGRLLSRTDGMRQSPLYNVRLQ